MGSGDEGGDGEMEMESVMNDGFRVYETNDIQFVCVRLVSSLHP